MSLEQSVTYVLRLYTPAPPNNSMEPTRPAAANRVYDRFEELAGRLISRPLGRHKHLSESKQPSMSQAIAKTVKGPVEYRLEGNGPTVMVLNGGHCSRESRLSHERLAE